MIAKADAGMGVSVAATEVPTKKSKWVPLPRIRPAHIPGTVLVKPAKALVLKAAQQTAQ
jgi:hypothetical protein